jgi:hypothetical protein
MKRLFGLALFLLGFLMMVSTKEDMTAALGLLVYIAGYWRMIS